MAGTAPAALLILCLLAPSMAAAINIPVEESLDGRGWQPAGSIALAPGEVQALFTRRAQEAPQLQQLIESNGCGAGLRGISRNPLLAGA